MAKSWKPENYSDVSPYVIARRAQATIDFLRQVFGATELRVYRNAQGGLVHGEVRIGNAVVMIADATDAWPPVPCHIHVYVPDVDAVYGAAVAAGGEAVQAPKTQAGDPDKRGGFKDPSGNTWWVSTQQ
jgi:uncharacterized glyoxalase superfamily protein PhnB